MSAIHLQAQMVDGAGRVAEFGLNWFIQSSLLLAVGFCVGWLLRSRGSAVQSAVYRITLVTVLACPLVTWILAMTGVSGYSIDLPVASAGPNISETSALNGIALEDDPDTATATATIAFSTQPSTDSAASPIGFERAISSGALSAEPPVMPFAMPASPTSKPILSTNESSNLAPHRVGEIAAAFCLTWLIVSVALLARLAGAWRQLSRIRRTSADADPATIEACREVAALLKIARPEVKRSPYLPSPCLAGLRRPVVLLPEAFQAMSVRNVLIHELAHLRRRDCHWSLLARLASAIFFFQPLLWKLLRRLDATAEEVCDDYVMQLGGDRQEYAHRLVDIAALSTTPVAAAAVGIVSVKSMLAKRVTRITDSSRCLSTRVGSLLLMLVLAGGLLSTTAAGLVRLEPRSVEENAESSGNITPEQSNVPQDGEKTDVGRDSFAVHGRVVDGAGKPVANAHVAAVTRDLSARQGGDYSPHSRVLGEVVADGQGQYILSFSRLSSKTHRDAMVIARMDGMGIVWQELNLDAASVEASLTLPREEPIRGRFVDREGKPAGSVRFSIGSVEPRVEGWGYAEGVGYDNPGPMAAWLPDVTSDQRGQFTIRGVPEGHGVDFQIDDERFAPQSISLNTGRSEKRLESDGTYRAQVKNVGPGEEALLTLVPARFFEGLVRCADTKEPVLHAKISIWAAQEEHGSMSSVVGETDADGKYRIRPKPGIYFGVNAYPPEGTPYLIRTVRDLEWDVEDGSAKQVDVTLPRGVLVRGKVVESGTDEPIVGASVQYVPEKANNPHVEDDIITGWQNIRLSNEQGEFQIGVLPGPGRLFVHAPENEYVLRQTSNREFSRGTAGGARVYAHAIEKFDLEVDSEPVEVTIALDPSPMITGELVDEQGAPVEEGLAISRLGVHAYWLQWKAVPQTILDGQFQIAGLAPGGECPVSFLDSKRRLGATIVAKAGDGPLRVVLKPCGQFTARFVDSEGKPLVDYGPTVLIVVTPGPHRYTSYYYVASRLGLLAANTDFVANVDRVNHWERRKTDEQGRVTVPALIPGATYSVPVTRDGEEVIAKTFEAKANETLDLGDIVMDRRD